jgi:antitoxin CcdA
MSATDKPDARTSPSSPLEQPMAEAIGDKQQKAWAAENSEAVSAYNEYVESRSVFSDGLRSF